MPPSSKSCFQTKYLEPDVIAGFSNYKYSCVDTNPLSNYVMHPFWDRVVQLCPQSVAPNLLTFSGFLFTFLIFLVLSYYDYYFYASTSMPGAVPVPAAVWYFGALCIFLAHTLDGIDGKQARRTKSSTPLGELFDHGVDSWTTLFIPACLYSVFGRLDYSISVSRMYFCLWNVLLCFYLSHWEKYNTGLLYLPWSYDLSMCMTVIVFTITGAAGHALWKFNLHFATLPAGVLFEIALYIGSLGLTLPLSTWHVFQAQRNGTGPPRNLYEMNRPLIPLLALFLPCLAWVLGSPGNILERDPRCVFFLTGTLFSNICCRLIVNQMSNTRADIFNWLLLPLYLVVGCLLLFPPFAVAELYLLYTLTTLTTIAHVHYGVCVVKQMAAHLNISAFSLKKIGPDE